MTTLHPFSVTALLLLLACATWIDFKDRRIPNAVVLSGLVLALGIGASDGGTTGVLMALAGIVIGGFFLLPYYLAGGMGAGDVKLMAMAGAFLGPLLAVAAAIATLLIGAAIATLCVLGARLSRSDTLQSRHAAPAPYAPSRPDAIPSRAIELPYALPILLGTLAAVLLRPAIALAVS